METKLNIVTAPAPNSAPAAPAPSSSAADPQDAGKAVADLRLVIEPDPNVGGGYVYKTIDRRTGDVVLELPRTTVASLPDAPGYAAGDVVRTRA
jgi:flagellar protein FlaG